MGPLLSCCKKHGPAAENDPRAALRSGARIKVIRNETEDPRAPLLTKASENYKEKEPMVSDKNFEEFIDNLSSGDDLPSDDKAIEALLSDKDD